MRMLAIHCGVALLPVATGIRNRSTVSSARSCLADSGIWKPCLAHVKRMYFRSESPTCAVSEAACNRTTPCQFSAAHSRGCAASRSEIAATPETIRYHETLYEHS